MARNTPFVSPVKKAEYQGYDDAYLGMDKQTGFASQEEEMAYAVGYADGLEYGGKKRAKSKTKKG